MADIESALVVRMEASLAKMEKQMARALRVASDTSTGIEKRFDQMGSRMARSSENAARGLTRVLQVGGAGRFVLQNTANQLGDIAVQLEMGTSPARVMSQQLPQLLGGFGALGGVLGVVAPLLGTVAAVGIPLAAMFLATGDDAEKSGKKIKTFADMLSEAESALKSAEQALAISASGGISDLYDRYGEVTEAVRALADELAQIEVRAAKIEVGKVIEAALGADFKSQINELFGGVGSAIVAVTEEDLAAARKAVQEIGVEIKTLEALNQIVPQALRDDFARANEELAALEGRFKDAANVLAEMKISPELVQQISQVEAKLRDALAAGDFLAVADSFAIIRDLLREAGQELDQGVVDGLTQAEDKARAAAKALDQSAQSAADTAEASAGIGPALQPGVDAAAALARNFGIALSLAQQLEKNAYEATVGRGRGGDPRQFGGSAEDIQQNVPGAQLAYQPGGSAGVPLPKAGGRRGRGGGRNTPQSIFDSAQAQVDAMQRQIEMLGKTDAEVAKLTARYRLLDEAKKKGIDLDAVNAATGQTVRQEIDRQAESVGRLTLEYEQARQRAEFFEDAQQSLRDGFIDSIVEGENLSGVLENLAKSLAKAALQAALFGDGPFGNGGSGLLGGLFGGLFKPRAGGGMVSAGSPYMVGEAGPEPFFPKVDGRILSVSQAQSALRSASGASGGNGSVHVTVSMDQNGNLVPLIQKVSGQVSARAVGVGMAAQDRKLPGNIQSYSARRA